MAPINFQSLSDEEKRNFISSFDTIVSDCDGVIWDAKGLIAQSNTIFNKLHTEQAKQIYFLTNNSTKTREQLLSKFHKTGFQFVTVDSVISTAYLAATYLKDKIKENQTVYVVGADSICEELKKFNIKSFGPGLDYVKNFDMLEDISSQGIELCDNVGAVIVGFDLAISYMKILKAATYLKNKDILFVVTNTDETFPSACELVLPGCGSSVAAVQTACGREPFIVGKPSSYVAQVLKEKKVNPERTLFIGDRLNTDIIAGKISNSKTLLVLSGIHQLEDVERCAKSSDPNDQMSIPDYYTNNVADLLSM